MTQNQQNYGIILVTAASEAEAEKIAEALVAERLAACISLTPIRSIYTWKGEVHRDQEWQLMIKTDLALFDRLTARVHELHSYELPEVIALPIGQGSVPYLQWIGEQVRG